MKNLSHPQLDPTNVTTKKKSDLSVINLIAGPGAGKTTTMAFIFGTLKRRGINCEMAPEWVKMAAWEGRSEVFNVQGYLLEKQNWVLHRLRGKVEVVVSDSPLILAAAYSELHKIGVYDSVDWKTHCKAIFDTYDNFNVFLNRKKAYNPAGRNQSLAQAQEVDRILKKVLDEFKVPYIEIEDSDTVHLEIIDLYEKEKGKLRKYTDQ